MNISKFIPNVVTNKLGRQMLVLSKNSPHILFGAGVVGFGATIVLAVRATRKLDDILDQSQDRLNTATTLKEQTDNGERPGTTYTDNDFRQDKVIIYTRTGASILKIYGPAVVIGAASIGALTGSHIVLNRRYLGVTAAYAALEKGFDEYRKRVTEEYGEEKDRQFRYGLVDKNIVESTDTGDVIKTIKLPSGKDASIYARYFDAGSRRFQREDSYNQVFVRVQQDWANDMLHARGHLFLNEVYDLLGFDRTPAGSVVGWVRGPNQKDGFVDFGVLNNWDGMRFINGDERSVLLDFNVDGVIYNLI